MKIKKCGELSFRIGLVSLILVFSCLMPSCAAIPGYSEPEDQAVVCAIGFDVEGDSVRVTLQLSESGGEEVRTVEGVGTGIDLAISRLAASESSSLEVAHLSLIVIGDSVDGARFNEILDFCDRNDSVSTSARLVSATSARELLGCGVSGYDLTKMLSETREDSSLGAESRLYRVKGILLSDDRILTLPHFFTDGDTVELYGLRMLRGGETLTVLDRAEGAYYLMMRGLYSEGAFGGDATGLSFGVGVASCVTKYALSGSTLTVSLLITIDSEIANDEHAEAIISATERGAEELYKRLFELYGDVFGYADLLKRGFGEEQLSVLETPVRFECKNRR